MSPTFVCAMDQGTTGNTVLIFDEAFHLKGRGYRDFPQQFPRTGWVEHDPEILWTCCLEAVQDALNSAGIAARDLSAIGITNQRETVLLWDRKTGQPLAPAIVWQDRRTADFCAQLKENGQEDFFRSRTGLLLDPYFSGTKIRWFLDAHPDARSRLKNRDLLCGTMDTWLIWKLTGGQRYMTDPSNASRTLLYDLHTQDWSDELCDRLGVPREGLPEIGSNTGPLAETDPEAFFGARIPITGLAGDQQAALFGQTCFQPGMVKNTYGTGSFLLMNAGNKVPAPAPGLLSTVAWKLHNHPMVYAVEGAVFITGAAVQWLRDGLQILDDAAESETLARSLSSNEGVYFVPALSGLGSPYWDPYARGLLIGLTRGTTRAHLARAALEAMAYQTRDVVESMSAATGHSLEGLRADGGAVANRFLMQFQADLLHSPVEVAALHETTALGAAALAGLGAGIWTSLEELSALRPPGERYESQTMEADFEALYRRWKNAVARSRDWA